MNRIQSAQHLSGNNNHNNMIPMGTCVCVCVFLCVCVQRLYKHALSRARAQINISIAGNKQQYVCIENACARSVSYERKLLLLMRVDQVPNNVEKCLFA